MQFIQELKAETQPPHTLCWSLSHYQHEWVILLWGPAWLQCVSYIHFLLCCSCLKWTSNSSVEECVESQAAVRCGSCLWKRAGRVEGEGGGLSSIRGISRSSRVALSSHVWSCLVGSTCSAGELLSSLPFVDKAEVKQCYVTALSLRP